MTKTMTKILAIAAMISAAATNSSAQNQNNLGADWQPPCILPVNRGSVRNASKDPGQRALDTVPALLQDNVSHLLSS